MKLLWKWPIVAICAVLNSAILLSAAQIFDFPIIAASSITALVDPFVAFVSKFSDLNLRNENTIWAAALIHYFSISILTATIGELGYWRTFNRAYKTISRLIHFFLWPIAPLWHLQWYSIYKRFATGVWKSDGIPYKSVIWAYWASIGYFYLFWALTVILVVYSQNQSA